MPYGVPERHERTLEEQAERAVAGPFDRSAAAKVGGKLPAGLRFLVHVTHPGRRERREGDIEKEERGEERDTDEPARRGAHAGAIPARESASPAIVESPESHAIVKRSSPGR